MSPVQTFFLSKSTRHLKRSGWFGIAIGVLAVLLCELPIVLTILGLSSFVSVATGYRLPPLFEQFAIGAAIVGALVVVVLTVVRYIRRQGTH